jgi:hypothetical protein
MAKAKVLRDLMQIDDHVVFEKGEEVYAFWFDSEGIESVDCATDLPEDSEGWTLHIQEIGRNGEQVFHPNEWDFDDASTDDIEIVEAS